MLSNILLKISYDGTNYSGFQIQPNAPTIQACLEDALSFLAKERIRVTAAGRTDAGVHAKGQVVNFKSRISVPIEKLPVALNSILPRDIRVEMAQLVEDSFHARYSAIEKTYSYQVYQAPIQSCFLRLYSLWVSNPIDWEKVEQAGKMLIGKHDFKGFAATGSSVQTSVRTMKDFQIKEGRLTTMYFTADGFYTTWYVTLSAHS